MKPVSDHAAICVALLLATCAATPLSAQKRTELWAPEPPVPRRSIRRG
jgi:hypothetical protein